MKATLPILAVIAPFALAANPAQDTINLTQRFEAGQTFVISNSIEFSGDIDDVSALVDGQEMLEGGIEGDMEGAVSMSMTETIDSVREGEISGLTVTLDDASMDVSGAMNAMGESQTFDESEPMPAVGHTVKVTIAEDGTIEREDVTEDAEPLSDEELASVSHRNHFDMLLPKEAVEIGAAFELDTDWDELFAEMMQNMDSADLDPEAARAAEVMMEAFADATEIEATGTVIGVEEGIATIEYSVYVNTSITDLMELVRQIAPPEAAGQIPPADAALEFIAEMEGVGKFNVEKGYLNALSMAGEFSLDLSGSMDMGQQMEGSAAMSGEFAMESTIELQ